MAERKRKPTDKKRPAFTMTPVQQDGDNDLQKEKERIKKELEANELNDKEWFDKELEKNLKNIK